MDKDEPQNELNLLKSLNKDEPHDKSSLEANIAKNLDEILINSGDELMSLPIDSLYNIFFHQERKLIDHNRAYRIIKDNSKKQKKSDLFILLPSIDGAKLNLENLRDAILSEDMRDGNIPKINYLEILDLIQNIKKQDERIENQNAKIEKQNRSIRTGIFSFFVLFILIIAYFYFKNLNKIFSKQQELLENIKSLDKEFNSKLQLMNNELASKINSLSTKFNDDKKSFKIAHV